MLIVKNQQNRIELVTRPGHVSESDHNYDLDDDMEMHGENSYESIKCVGEEEATVAPSAAVAPDGMYVNNFLTMGRCGAT